jgi:phosphoribosyl 1,2-cyclic phosphodiesterase
MKVVVIASGSGGNATLFESGGTRVLVDAGVGPRTLADKLREAGSDLPQAIVITHAHQDHVGQCLRLSRRFKIPIYASEATARIDLFHGREQVRVYSPREPFMIGALTISPLPLPHDAAQVSLVFSDGERRAAIVTDLGEVPPALPGHLAGCDIALIEANHDPEMLQRGPYPAFLKRRISSARGHLSNLQTHTLLRNLSKETHTVVLMHLSETNNRPDLALTMAKDALSGRRIRLFAAAQNDCLALDAAAPLVPTPLGGLRRAEQLSLFAT